MTSERFKQLPLNLLYDSMVASMKELLVALDSDDPNPNEINGIKKRCELLHEAIVFVRAKETEASRPGSSL